MPPTAFATSEPLSDDDLHAVGPPRYPRPSRLAEPLTVKPPKAATAAERLGLQTVGQLLEHLPRDRQDARTIIELEAGETATVVVEVRSITSRSVRRRGLRWRDLQRRGEPRRPRVARRPGGVQRVVGERLGGGEGRRDHDGQ